jgi:hypothetical protein
MKSVFALLSLIGLSLLSSCCKTYCTDEMLLVSLQKFKRVDVDSTYFISYQKGSGFTQKTDSIADIKSVNPGDTLNSGEIKILDITKDWVVKIPSLNKPIISATIIFPAKDVTVEMTSIKKFPMFR